MKLHTLLALCLISTLHAADPAWFQWHSSPPLIGSAEDTAEQARHQHHGALFQEAVESISSGGIAKP
jgi:hypothetical protein